MSARRMKRGLTAPELFVGLVFVGIAVLACLSPAQSDTFWALRAGEDIWRHGRVPLVDTYSYTAAGRPWPDHEWLWQALAYALYRAGGFPLLTAGVAAAVTGAYAIAYRLMAGPWLLRIVLLLAALTLGTNVWSLRPQVASLLLLALLLSLLVRGRLALIPPLFALWANLHGGVVLGGLVMVAATITAAIYDRRRLPALALVTALGGAATLLTPLGVGLWTFIAHWMVAARQTGVSEWDPVTPFTKEGIVFWILAAGLIAIAIKRWRRLETWPDRLLAITALVLLAAAARAIRNVSPFLLVGAAAASRLLFPASSRTPGPAGAGAPARDRPRRPRHLVVLAAASAVAVAAIAACWSAPRAMLGWRPITPSAVAAIESCPGPLWNSYDVGGVLVWFVRDRPVFIDGRHDPYPPELIVEDGAVERGADYRPLFRRYAVRCAALATNAILADNLRKDGWRPRFSDAEWTVLEAP
jgi:hypothetical protein